MWLQRNPDPAWDAEMAEIGRIGKDGKVYTEVPEAEVEEDEEPPKPKRIRSKAKAGAAVEREVNRYLAELTDRGWAQWVLDHADAEDRDVLALKLDNLAATAARRSEDGPRRDSGEEVMEMNNQAAPMYPPVPRICPICGRAIGSNDGPIHVACALRSR
jgi:hypothetical protein